MQKTYSLYPSQLIEGAVFDDSLNQIETMAAEEDIAFGVPVRLGTKTDAVTANSSPTRGLTNLITSVLKCDGTSFYGIAIRSDITPVGSTISPDNTTDYATLVTLKNGVYSIGSSLRVMLLGRICVNINTVTASGKNVYYTNTGNYVVNTSAPANSILVGKALGTITAPGLAVIQVNNIN